MATVNKLKSGKWCAQIRSHNKYISKTFLKKSNASAWAKEIEYQFFKKLICGKRLARNFVTQK